MGNYFLSTKLNNKRKITALAKRELASVLGISALGIRIEDKISKNLIFRKHHT